MMVGSKQKGKVKITGNNNKKEADMPNKRSKSLSKEATRSCDPPGRIYQEEHLPNLKKNKAKKIPPVDFGGGSSRWTAATNEDHSGRTASIFSSHEFLSSKAQKHATGARPLVSYEVATWTIYLAFTTLAIVDRFVWNIWPRQTFSIGGGSAGTDRLTGFKPGPWSVQAYDVVARVSGRFAICCFNLLLITRLRSLEHWMPSSFIGKYILDCSDIVRANIRLHRWNAIALCVITFIHVWSILFPCVIHGYSAQVISGSFEYPLSERAPKGFKDANAETQTMSLQVDDVFRMVEMTILLGVLTPLSVRWLSRRWHIGIHIHRFVMVIYFVDIVRRHTHPHSWVLNTPVFVIWLLDKAWIAFVSSRWSSYSSPTVTRIRLSQDYMLLRWINHNKQQGTTTNDSIGEDYYLRLKESSCLETAHVFTTFKNRIGVQLFDGNDNKEEEEEWSVACIIRVFRNKRVPQIGSKDSHSHTLRMYEEPSPQLPLKVWGPKQGEMSALVKYQTQNPKCANLVVIGSGAGINYIVDAMQYCLIHHPACLKLTMLYSTRDIALFRWVKSTVQRLLHHHGCPHSNMKIVLALTGSSPSKLDEVIIIEADEHSTIESQQPNNNIKNNDVLRIVMGRINFIKMIPRGSSVFFQGSSSVRENVSSICKIHKANFVGGIGG